MSKKAKNDDYYQKLGALSVSSPIEYLENLELFKQSHHHKWHKTPLVFSAITALIFLGLGTALILKHGSLAPIRVAGLPVKATISEAELQHSIATAAKNYSLNLKYTDGSQQQYKLADTGVSIDAASSAKAAKKTIGHSFLRDLEWWRPLDIGL
jgi:hypothetical protein